MSCFCFRGSSADADSDVDAKNAPVQAKQQQQQAASLADVSATVVRPGSSSNPKAKAAADRASPPPPRDADALLRHLGARSSLPNAAAVAAYLGTATDAASAQKTTKTPAPMPAALSGLAAAVNAEPAAAEVVSAALDLHALSRSAVVNKPNIARMDALGAACVSALDRAGRKGVKLPADVCLAVAAVLRDCCALAEGFGREGWLLRLACGGAALRDEAEMLHGAALELLSGGGLGWAVPTPAQQRRAALSLAALAGEGAAAALLAALEAESAEIASAAAAGEVDGTHSSALQHVRHQSRGGVNNTTSNNPSAGGGASAGGGYVDASRPLRRALRQLGRGRGLAAGVAAAAADPDAADELARLLGVSPAALQAELRAVPVADGADDLAGLLAAGGGSGGATAVEPAVAAAAPAPVAQQQHQNQNHHARLDLDALHAQLLTRRDAAAFLRAGGAGAGGGEGGPKDEPAVAAAASPVPPLAAAPAPAPSTNAKAQPFNPPKLRHPHAFARYSTFDPPLGDPSAGVSFAGVRAALHELGLLPSSNDSSASFSPLSSSSDAAVRRHMALALGWGASAASTGGATAAPAFMPPETFDRFFEGVLAANPRARVVDAAGVAVEADLRRVHAAYAAFGHGRSGGGGGSGGGTAASSRSPIAARPAWTGVIGRSGGGVGGLSNDNNGPLLDSAQLSKLLRECGLLPALSSQQAAASKVLPSPLVRLTAADVDIVYTKCCVAAAAAAAGSSGGGAGGMGVPVVSSGSGALAAAAAAGASPSPNKHASSASSPSPPPALKRARGLDFDAFCAALVALSERTGAPLQTVLGAVAASSGPVAAASVYYGASVAGSRVMGPSSASVVGTSAGGALRASRPQGAAGGKASAAARAAGSVAAASVSGSGGAGGGKVGAAWKR